MISRFIIFAKIIREDLFKEIIRIFLQQIHIVVPIDNSIHLSRKLNKVKEEVLKLLKLKFAIRTGSGTRGKSYGIKNHLLAKCRSGRACVRGKIFKRGLPVSFTRIPVTIRFRLNLNAGNI